MASRVWLDRVEAGPELRDVSLEAEDEESGLALVRDKAAFMACLGQRCALLVDYQVERTLGWGDRAFVVLRLGDGSPLWLIDKAGERECTWGNQWRRLREQRVSLRAVPVVLADGALGLRNDNYYAVVAALRR